jgi:hypothetical protein
MQDDIWVYHVPLAPNWMGLLVRTVRDRRTSALVSSLILPFFLTIQTASMVIINSKCYYVKTLTAGERHNDNRNNSPKKMWF